jgi:hypothetical protein
VSSIEKINRAIQLALDHVVDEYRQTVVVQAAQLPDEARFGFDPEGWAIFVVLYRYQVGSAKYVAVHMETGETKSLGSYGE